MRQGEEIVLPGRESVSPSSGSRPALGGDGTSREAGSAQNNMHRMCNENRLSQSAVNESSSCFAHLGGRKEPCGQSVVVDNISSEERMPLDEERCQYAAPTNPYLSLEHREESIHDDEQRLVTEAGQIHCLSQQSCDERESIASQSDFHDDDESDEYCYGQIQLLLRDEEEERMQQQHILWEDETNRRLYMEQQEENNTRELERLDELLQIYDEEYPEQYTMEGAQQYELRTENNNLIVIIDNDDDEEIIDNLGDSLSENDSQIEELVALCDRHDRENQNNPTSNCDKHLRGGASTSVGTTAASPAVATPAGVCVVCLEAPRTHAYVPCGHFCVCFSCAKEQTKQRRSFLAASNCPVCQQPSTRVMRIFIP